MRVFERYSFFSSGRVSLSVTLFSAGDTVHISAITAGGSRGIFIKMNTVGEETFLKKLRELFPE